MKYAPIALFAYNRLWHLRQTIGSLLTNEIASMSELFIFSDGPKNNNAVSEVAKVRAYITSITGFKQIHIIERDENFGLAKSIISGVSMLLNQFSKVIVLEDDLVVSPYFLQFMNEGLQKYENQQQVASIHGYVMPVKEKLPETFFLRGADCWGWATWKRAWKNFEPDGTALLSQLQKNKWTKEFDFNHSTPNVQMLKDQIANKNNSWAIRWHASAFIHHMLTLYPGKSLVQNIGMDNSGQHCLDSASFDVEIHQYPIALNSIAIEQSKIAYQAYVNYFNSIRETFFKKILIKTKKVLSL
jgi:hypothetical protein